MKRLILMVCAVGVLLPTQLFAFCGFYVGGGSGDLFNDATNVVLMRHETKTVLSMQNDYQGPPEDFALIIPVPQVLKKEQVKTLPREIFDRIDALAAPRLVEYWEQDPCMRERSYEFEDQPINGEMMKPTSEAAGRVSRKKPVVKIEAKFSVAEYDILMLSTDDSLGLDEWLRDKKYNIPKNADRYFQPYVQQGMYFFVAKVNSKKVTFDPGGRARLSPIRFHYNSGDFSLPIRLGLINSRGEQDLIVHILAENQRFEVGNYPSVEIPTNLELTQKARPVFGSFYASLFDAVLEKHPGAVVTEYAWQATKCDPCPPGSAGLSREDIMTLGADVIRFNKAPRNKFRVRKSKHESNVVANSIPPNMVLTRLHARYSSKTVGQDLVFKKAGAIVGGRPGDPSYTATESGFNQFQGRYIIRHPWEGEIACQNPVRGVWGRPNPNQMQLARDTAYADNRDFQLDSVLLGDIPIP